MLCAGLKCTEQPFLKNFHLKPEGMEELRGLLILNIASNTKGTNCVMNVKDTPGVTATERMENALMVLNLTLLSGQSGTYSLKHVSVLEV